MSHVADLWERLVHAAVQRDRTVTDAYGMKPINGIAEHVTPPHSNARDIEAFLQAADEVQDEDCNISRILCEHAYGLAQKLDPNTEGTGVLRFKTATTTMHRRTGNFDRSQDITRLGDFYKLYRNNKYVDKLHKNESGNFQDVFATLKAVGTALQHLSNEVYQNKGEAVISEELKRMIEYDASMIENGIPHYVNVPAMRDSLSSSPKSFSKFSVTKRRKRTSFGEYRELFHIYDSFGGLWMFLLMMFQALVIVSFNDGNLGSKTICQVLSLGPTYFFMKLVQSAFDFVVLYGAYSTTRKFAILRILICLAWFISATIFIYYIYAKHLVKKASSLSESIIFQTYTSVLCIYAGVQCFWSPLAWLTKGVREEQDHVNAGPVSYHSRSDYFQCMLFWLFVLGSKLCFSYFLQIRPLVKTTRDIIEIKDIHFSWHEFAWTGDHNVVTIAYLWLPMFCMYLLDIHVFYTIVSYAEDFWHRARNRFGGSS